MHKILIFFTLLLIKHLVVASKIIQTEAGSTKMTTLLLKIASIYRNLSNHYPFRVNCATGFIIASFGDVICQKFISRKDNKFVWDSRRTLDMGLIRAFVISPIISAWFPFLARLSPGTSITSVAGRVFLDQTIASPVVIVLVFITSNFLKGGTLAFAIERIRKELLQTWITGLKYWPFVHMVNFGLVPLTHQALVAHFASLYWNSVLSYYANVAIEPAKTEKTR